MADDETKDRKDKDDQTPANDRRDVDVAVSEVVSKYGGERAALRVLMDQQLDYRRDLRELKKKVPADGTRVLTADEAKEFDAFVALGKKPKELAGVVEQHAALTTENADLKAERVIDEAAQLLGYKPAVLRKLAKTEGFRIEVRDAKNEKDEPTRVPFAILGEGDAAKATALADFAASALSDFLPSLTTNGNGSKATAPNAPIPPQPPKGTAPAPKQKDLAAIAAEKRATGVYSQF